MGLLLPNHRHSLARHVIIRQLRRMQMLDAGLCAGPKRREDQWLSPIPYESTVAACSN